MSGNGAVWRRVRGRLRAFPERLAACGAEAAAYGRCLQASMAPGGRLRKDLCAQEFEALRSCFAAAVGGRSRPPLADSPRERDPLAPLPFSWVGVGRLLVPPTSFSPSQPTIPRDPAAAEPVCLSGGGTPAVEVPAVTWPRRRLPPMCVRCVRLQPRGFPAPTGLPGTPLPARQPHFVGLKGEPSVARARSRGPEWEWSALLLVLDSGAACSH